MAKKKKVNKLEDVEVFEVSLVGKPAIGRTFLLTKAVDEGSEGSDDFTSEELEKYVQDNVGEEENIEKETKREDGINYPASAFAYVPDPDKPSSWKLRLWESPSKKVTARQVGMAVAALGKGFRGNKVQIPSEDLNKVKARVRAAWQQVHSEEDELPAVLKSEEAGTPPANNSGVDAMPNEKLVKLLEGAELSAESREALTGALDTVIQSKVPAELMKGFYELAGYEIPKEEVVKEVIKEVPVEKDPEPENETEALLKSMEDGPAKEKIAALLKKEQEDRLSAQKEAEEAKLAKEAAEQEAILKEFIAEANKTFEHLGEADKIGKTMKAMKDALDEEDYELARGMFAKAEEYVVKAKQFEELGVGGGDDTDNAAKIDALAKELMAKNDKLSIQKARVRVRETHPELSDFVN